MAPQLTKKKKTLDVERHPEKKYCKTAPINRAKWPPTDKEEERPLYFAPPLNREKLPNCASPTKKKDNNLDLAPPL